MQKESIMGRSTSKLLKHFMRMIEPIQLVVNAVLEQGGNDRDLARFRKRLLKEPELRRQLATLIIERPAVVPYIEYFTPVMDDDVTMEHQPVLAKYRSLATEWGVPATTAICYLVRAGFTLKAHAAKAGPCVENFQYLQDLKFPDEPTRDCLVFWVPRLVPKSTHRTTDEQMQFLADLRKRMALPEHHLNSFGSAALDAGLILAHHKAAGSQVPLNGLVTRTDSCDATGGRLHLGWNEAQLDCGKWAPSGSRNSIFGVFALGVETLGR